MIIIAGTVKLSPADAQNFVDKMAEISSRVIQNDDCLHYSFLIQNKATALVNVLEMWASQDALDRHLQQPWIQEVGATFLSIIESSTCQIYDIAGVRPLVSPAVETDG